MLNRKGACLTPALIGKLNHGRQICCLLPSDIRCFFRNCITPVVPVMVLGGSRRDRNYAARTLAPPILCRPSEEVALHVV